VSVRNRAGSSLLGAIGLVQVAVVIFAVGLIALAAIFVLAVSGHHDLPLWLNTTAGVLVPLGLGLALFAIVGEARR
jgi:hypothetical protein